VAKERVRIIQDTYVARGAAGGLTLQVWEAARILGAISSVRARGLPQGANSPRGISRTETKKEMYKESDKEEARRLAPVLEELCLQRLLQSPDHEWDSMAIERGSQVLAVLQDSDTRTALLNKICGVVGALVAAPGGGGGGGWGMQGD
jgi:hypothetical protein